MFGEPHNAAAKSPAHGPSVPLMKWRTTSRNFPFHSDQRPPKCGNAPTCAYAAACADDVWVGRDEMRCVCGGGGGSGGRQNENWMDEWALERSVGVRRRDRPRVRVWVAEVWVATVEG
eukprot:361012-Chlamydomonas_euryale.AAC.5